MPHVGIAIATTVAGWLNALLLWATLKRRGHFIADGGLIRRLALLCLASLIMGVLLFFASRLLAPLLAPASGLGLRTGTLAALVGCGALTFLALAEITGAVRLRSMLARALRRR